MRLETYYWLGNIRWSSNRKMKKRTGGLERQWHGYEAALWFPRSVRARLWADRYVCYYAFQMRIIREWFIRSFVSIYSCDLYSIFRFLSGLLIFTRFFYQEKIGTIGKLFFRFFMVSLTLGKFDFSWRKN